MIILHPEKGVCDGAKIFGSALLQPARRVCVSLSTFFITFVIEGIRERTKHLDIFLFVTYQWCSISDVLFTGGRGVSDFSVLK